ncbi:hypothetical protein [Brachybacterium squillarum]|uniref:hypothetical protein n=1 Tax=Brachybacterium squillarum TaxID=661979 RepID=UPI0022222BCC|nr:hypothetical protein [Brachybacterium squillarum]MCW1803863.1 hypothetical protein [Brachybacterium squillarum]
MTAFLVALYLGFGLVALQLLLEAWADRVRARYRRVPVIDRTWSKLREWMGLIIETIRWLRASLVDLADRLLLWPEPRRRPGRHADTPRRREGP